ncbi:MAG: pyridoxal phosphate-dependent aminotransferase [Deltaproteobacteria bacterium]|nr:pyridoxal phosphate-dependent aminotransferase [Deltaproteobacteria bacterium]
MKLSQRTAWPVADGRWAQARPPTPDALDLTTSNPTAVGLVHPPGILESLADPEASRYDPRPLGLPQAQRAVASYYGQRGRRVDPDRVWLCASTSEAYARLLTLLCDPGDAVAVAQPGYPLLDMLGDVAGVRRVPYPLAYDGAWHLDRAGLHAALHRDPSIRALVVIAPHNPTGHVPSSAEWQVLVDVARRHELALLVDEVFADYRLSADPSWLDVETADVTTVVLSGLSKVAALPQLKLSWAVFHGSSDELDELRRRAELLADAFLSVATPVQRALPALLAAADDLQPRIRERLQTNLQILREAVAGRPVDLLPVTAGWTALLRLPTIEGLDDIGWALQLLSVGVRVDPGFLFDLPAPPRVAVSLLTPPATMTEGIERLLDHVDAVVRGASAPRA